MDALFNRALKVMELSLLKIEQYVPMPVKVPFQHSFVFRYQEKTLEQALVQKLARVITGLHSAHILLINGFLQEQSAIQRMLEDFQEDITFLAYARLSDGVTDLHKRYLDAFYEEEFDKPDSPLDSTQRRPSIPRKKIRAFIAKKEGVLVDQSRVIEITRTLNKAYSGFVHGASPQIMNMYGGNPPQFQVSGMLGTPHEEYHRQDLWNYFYRGLITFKLVALVLRHPDLIKELGDFLVEFEEASGTDYMKHAQMEVNNLLNSLANN